MTTRKKSYIRIFTQDIYTDLKQTIQNQNQNQAWVSCLPVTQTCIFTYTETIYIGGQNGINEQMTGSLQ